jgi:hypothetical protein
MYITVYTYTSPSPSKIGLNMHCKNFGGKNFCLKEPKSEIFDLDFLTPINPIWVGDLGTGKNSLV